MELTAIQQLINELDIVNPHSVGQVKLMAKHYLELEKQQIIDACAFGRYVNQDDRTEGEQYYNRKYGTNQTDSKVD